MQCMQPLIKYMRVRIVHIEQTPDKFWRPVVLLTRSLQIILGLLSISFVYLMGLRRVVTVMLRAPDIGLLACTYFINLPSSPYTTTYLANNRTVIVP
jgi:hypothetical protein